MVLVIGTNCGFVTVAPVDDPAETGLWTVDDRSHALRDTSPAGAIKITEIGWWCDPATEEANFEVGIYTHDAGNNIPLNLLAGESRTNAKGTDAGWKRVTGLNIGISAETIYWIAFQLDNTATATNMNRSASGLGNGEWMLGQSSLASSWVDANANSTRLWSIYAVWEEAAEGTTRQVRISGSFEEKPYKIKIGGTFEDKPALVKVSGTFQ